MTSITVDTNILFYAADRTDARKHMVAKRCVAEMEQRNGSVPLQCLAELYRALTRKRVLAPE